jgi:hypothetical protein
MKRVSSEEWKNNLEMSAHLGDLKNDFLCSTICKSGEHVSVVSFSTEKWT